MEGKRVATTTGRVLFGEILPTGMPFDSINRTLKKKDLTQLIDDAYRVSGEKATVIFADRMRTLGYTFATRAGISIALHDMVIPKRKWEIVGEAKINVKVIEDEQLRRLLSN